jgi:hypothetical protein
MVPVPVLETVNETLPEVLPALWLSGVMESMGFDGFSSSDSEMQRMVFPCLRPP